MLADPRDHAGREPHDAADPTPPVPGIGRRGIRVEARQKLLGGFRYATQEHTAGELHAVTVRSALPSARIRAVRTAEALSLTGAVAVLTGADVPGRRLGSKVADQPVLADGVVRYHGEPVALVVAETPEDARAMAEAVVLDLDPSPALTEPRQALAPEAPRVGPEGNLVTRLSTVRGSARGTVTVRRRWRTGRQDAAFLAPEAGLAVPMPDGTVHLTLATQDIHADHAQVTRALGLAEEELVVHHSGIGGAFGGREDITLQAHLVLAARHTGRPVRMVYSRAESLAGHPSRHPMVTDVELTCESDGRFVSLRTRTVLDGGAYAVTSMPVTAIVHDFSAGMYRFDSLDLETVAVYTNNPVAGAMRGFGATQACFLIESTVDAVAEVLGLDPIEVRRRNLLRAGEPLATTGQPLAGCVDPREALDAVLAAPDPAPHRPGRRRGTAVALGIKSAGLGHGKPDPATASVCVTPEGIEVRSAASEVGQGVTEVLRRIAAERLPGLPVSVHVMSTAFPTAGGSKASRQTMASGGAVHRAAGEVRIELDRRLGRHWTRADLPRALAGGPIERVVTHDGPETGPGTPHKAFQIVAHRATVDVDEVTGSIQVAQVVCAQDCGRAIDPAAVSGQLIGGTAQGVGFALWEERLVSEGVQSTTGFGDYLLPTSVDLPEIIAIPLEHPHPDLALGAKGIGEGPLVSSPAAVAAAVRAATGTAVEAIPVWWSHRWST